MSHEMVTAVFAHLAAGKEIRLMDTDGDYTIVEPHEMRVMNGRQAWMVYCVHDGFATLVDLAAEIEGVWQAHLQDAGR